MRFGFVTCVQLGLDCLETIDELGGQVAEIYTLHDDLDVDKSGRVFLDAFAEDHGARLHKIRHVSDADTVALFREHDLDWLFIVGWSQIAKPSTLEAPRRGCIGIHPTLLPVGRGRAPIPWAIIKGLDETGVTMFQLDAGVDSGPIIEQVVLPIAKDETATTLYDRVGNAHRKLIASAWPGLASGDVRPRPQDHSAATTWPGRRPDDGAIQATMTVAEVDRLVRGVTRPYPGASFDRGAAGLLRVWSGSIEPPADPQIEPIEVSDGSYWPIEVESTS